MNVSISDLLKFKTEIYKAMQDVNNQHKQIEKTFDTFIVELSKENDNTKNVVDEVMNG